MATWRKYVRTAIRATVAVGLIYIVIAIQIREVATAALILALASALPFNVCLNPLMRLQR